jgi:hypothetical protein
VPPLNSAVRRQTHLSNRMLTPAQERIFRTTAKIAFGWWVVAASIGLLMNAFGGELLGVVLCVIFGAVGVMGWRLASRPLSGAFSIFKQRRESVEARPDEATSSSDTKNH